MAGAWIVERSGRECVGSREGAEYQLEQEMAGVCWAGRRAVEKRGRRREAGRARRREESKREEKAILTKG